MAKIDDVAKLAKVSKGTVSNVFSQKRPISKEVRQRVLEASRKLNYIPNHIARSLVTKQTMTLGLSMPSGDPLFLDSFQTELISGSVSEASRHKYRILIDTLAMEDLDTPHLTSYPMDGAIILNPRAEDPRIQSLRQWNLPFVVIGKPGVPGIDYVDNDNTRIAYDACRYLLELGHRNIMFLNSYEKMTVAFDRRAGYERALNEWKLPIREDYHFYKKVWKQRAFEYGYVTIKEWSLKRDDVPVSAMIVDDEEVATGAMKALHEANLSVPDDISLIAISGNPSTAGYSTPALTMMDLRASQLGAEAVNLLLYRIQSGTGAIQGQGNDESGDSSNRTLSGSGIAEMHRIVEARFVEKHSCRSIL